MGKRHKRTKSKRHKRCKSKRHRRVHRRRGKGGFFDFLNKAAGVVGRVANSRLGRRLIKLGKSEAKRYAVNKLAQNADATSVVRKWAPVASKLGVKGAKKFADRVHKTHNEIKSNKADLAELPFAGTGRRRCRSRCRRRRGRGPFAHG